MGNERATLFLFGESFKKGQTSLHDLLQAYDAFEGILDCTYSNATGVERFSEAVRKHYRIIIRETREESWDSVFEIFVTISPVLFGNPLTPTDLLAAAKATYDFLKCAFALRREGKKYEIKNDANGTVNVLTDGGTQYVFNAPVSINLAVNAKDMLPELGKLTELLQKGSLQQARVQGHRNEEILQLGLDEADLFSLQETPVDERYEFDGEIYRYNKRSRTGRLQVKELQELPAGNYTFKVNNPNIQDEVIISMIKRTTTIAARPVVIDDPITNEETIRYLEILHV